MSLNATNFVSLGPIKSVDMKQFVDLFTGVMIDQPVTFKNALMVGGSQSSSTPPLKLFGAVGQSGNLIELYPTAGAPTATFGFGAVGDFAWGPGSPAANDTFLSRVAMQNGHVTDTAGILIDPYLEVKGNIKSEGFVFANSATLTAPIGTPFLLQVNQDLRVDRNMIIDDELIFEGPAGKIRGVMQGVAVTERLTFQGSELDLASFVQVVPNGASQDSGWLAWNRSDPTNAAYLGMIATNTGVGLVSNVQGTGAAVPLTLNMLGTVAVRVNTNAITDVLGGLRVSGTQGPVPVGGVGLEIFCFPDGGDGNFGRAYLQPYNRAASQYVDLLVPARQIQLAPTVGYVTSSSGFSTAGIFNWDGNPSAISPGSYADSPIVMTTRNAQPPRIGFHMAGVAGGALYMDNGGLPKWINSGGVVSNFVFDTTPQTLTNKILNMPFAMLPNGSTTDLTNYFMVYLTGGTYLPSPAAYNGHQRWVKAWGGPLTIKCASGFGLYGPGSTGPNLADAPSGTGAGIVLANGESVHLYAQSGNWWVI